MTLLVAIVLTVFCLCQGWSRHYLLETRDSNNIKNPYNQKISSMEHGWDYRDYVVGPPTACGSRCINDAACQNTETGCTKCKRERSNPSQGGTGGGTGLGGGGFAGAPQHRNYCRKP